MRTRRAMLGLLAAGAFAPAAGGHTLYNQWIVYRRKHLLIGAHRQEMATYELALEVIQTLDHLLPEAAARAARAPHPQRLASLLGTRQLELAILTRTHVHLMQAGDAPFAAYGAIPLQLVTDLGSHVLVGHEAFPQRHAWLVSAAMRNAGHEYDPAAIPDDIARHPGSQAHLDGVPLEDLAGL